MPKSEYNVSIETNQYGDRTPWKQELSPAGVTGRKSKIMSKTMLTTADVPKYVKEIVPRLKLTTDYAENDLPGYTFKLYGKHKIGYEEQLMSDCEKLLNWCKRYYADACVASKHFWYTDVPAPHDFSGTRSHQRRAYELGYRNYIKVIITDPVAYRFEKDGYYREG